MALDHLHCDSLEEHRPHTWLLEEKKPTRYGQKSSAYYVECGGTSKDVADFSKWIDEMMEEPLAAWEKLLIMNLSDADKEAFKNTVNSNKGESNAVSLLVLDSC